MTDSFCIFLDHLFGGIFSPNIENLGMTFLLFLKKLWYVFHNIFFFNFANFQKKKNKMDREEEKNVESVKVQLSLCQRLGLTRYM